VHMAQYWSTPRGNTKLLSLLAFKGSFVEIHLYAE
jgi:hypothetical protein